MTRTEMISALEQEIQRLETVRTLLHNSRDITVGLDLPKRGAGATKKRQISPEGRRRIVEAQRRRWAKQKRQAAKGK